MENPNPIEQDQALSDATTYLEKIMLGLNPNSNRECHKNYLAGVLDTLKECGKISEEIRGKLYETYCF